MALLARKAPWIGARMGASTRVITTAPRRRFVAAAFAARSTLRGRFVASAAGIVVASAAVGYGLAPEVLAKSEDASEENKEDPLVMEVKKAKLNEVREKYSAAEEHYHAALRINDDQLKDGVVDTPKFMAHRAWILDAMANMAVAEKKPYKAERLFKEVINLLLQLGSPPEAPAVLEISIKLANIYTLMEDDEEKQKAAESGYVFVVDNQTTTVEQIVKRRAEGKAGLTDADVKEAQALLGWGLECYAKYLLHRKRLDEAVEQYNLCFSIAGEVYGRDSETYANMLNDAATALAERNLFEAATGMLEEALTIGAGKDWESEGGVLVNLGIVHLQRKMFDKAKEFCTRGRELGRKFNSLETLEEAAYCLGEWKKRAEEGVRVEGKAATE